MSSQEKKVPISVVIIAKNEEANISNCLESVKDWADEIIIVDDMSTDRTVSIATNYTEKIFLRKMEIEGRYRNWAYSQAKNDWVLSLDADEEVSEELKKEIERTLNSQGPFVAYAIPLRNYIGNYWVRFGGWYPASKVRLFRKDKFRYEEVEVHPRVFIDGAWSQLKGDIIHRGYPDFAHFLNSLNRQTTLEAQKWINTGRKMTLLHALWRTVERFFRTFFRKRGYKDGIVGFMVALFASLYQIISYAKFWEIKNKRSQDLEAKPSIKNKKGEE